MAKELKQIIVSDFQESLADLDGCILVDYRGLDAEQTMELRSTLREAGARMRVIHNRLMKQALAARDDVPDGFSELFRGPIAILYGGEGAPSTSKAYDRWRKKHKRSGEIRGGLFEGKVLSDADVEALAKLPDKETLQAQSASMMLSPLSVLASAANSLVAHFAGCVEARRNEQGGDA